LEDVGALADDHKVKPSFESELEITKDMIETAVAVVPFAG